MGALTGFSSFVEGQLHDWRGTRLSELHFWSRDTAMLGLLVFIAVCALLLLFRSVLQRRRPRRVGLPAVLAVFKPSRLAFMRHAPLLLALAGLPFFALALADPYTSLTQKRTSFPGRRICMMLDASFSMGVGFEAPTLSARNAALTSAPGTDTSNGAFFSTVAAAERFVRKIGRAHV